ncbi:MAG: hypothetical protein WC370_08550 [Dehalococcoidales bacterium]
MANSIANVLRVIQATFFQCSTSLAQFLGGVPGALDKEIYG